MSFTGAPETPQERVRRWFAPSGGTMRDGARLAIINTGVLLASGFVWLFALVISRIIDLVLPWPLVATRFIGVVLLAIVAIVIAYTFADAHGSAARRAQRAVRSDLLGIVGALPFAVFAISLSTESLLRMLVAIVTFNGDRFTGALERFIFALVFIALTIGVVIAARVAERDEGGIRSV